MTERAVTLIGIPAELEDSIMTRTKSAEAGALSRSCIEASVACSVHNNHEHQRFATHIRLQDKILPTSEVVTADCAVFL